MYVAEKTFEDLTPRELYATLRSILEDDYYVSDFESKTLLLRDFLYVLCMHDLVYTTSVENRVLLTPKGEIILQKLSCMLI